MIQPLSLQNTFIYDSRISYPSLFIMAFLPSFLSFEYFTLSIFIILKYKVYRRAYYPIQNQHSFYCFIILYILQMQSLNSWFSVNTLNYNHKCQQTKKYGQYRFKLGLYCSKLLTQLQFTWWLDAGNLLGAYRDGRMIAHDDDFDLAVLASQDYFQRLFNDLQQKLDKNFKIRKIQSYSYKMQVFDPHQGHYTLDPVHKVDFHNVTVNIQLYKRDIDDKIKIVYFKDDFYNFLDLTQDLIFPLTTIKYCGHKFNCPNKVEKYLENYYGYIGLGAQYDKVTRKYRQNYNIPKNVSNKADEGNHEQLKNE